MDSDRRHELEENSLARAVRKAPQVIWDYGAYVLLGVAIIVAIYFFFRNRQLADVAERQATAQGLYNMVTAVRDAERLRMMNVLMPPEYIAQQQAELRSTFESFAPLASQSQSTGTRAHGLRLRGDFAWIMASFPPPAPEPPATGPVTQPATAPATRPIAPPATLPVQDWLDQAHSAYSQVVEQYPEQTADNVAALFGLAAIAEQRGEFEKAGEHYEQIVARQDIGEGMKNVARERKALLRHLRLDVRLVAATQPAGQPGTAGSVNELQDAINRLLAATQPATQPSTGTPGTQPSRSPTTGPAATQPR